MLAIYICIYMGSPCGQTTGFHSLPWLTRGGQQSEWQGFQRSPRVVFSLPPLFIWSQPKQGCHFPLGKRFSCSDCKQMHLVLVSSNSKSLLCVECSAPHNLNLTIPEPQNGLFKTWGSAFFLTKQIQGCFDIIIFCLFLKGCYNGLGTLWCRMMCWLGLVQAGRGSQKNGVFFIIIFICSTQQYDRAGKRTLRIQGYSGGFRCIQARRILLEKQLEIVQFV